MLRSRLADSGVFEVMASLPREPTDNRPIHCMPSRDFFLADSLAGIGRQPTLERLHLGKTRVADVGLARLRELDKMQSLALYEASITDAGLANARTAITDVGLQKLGAVPVARRLGLTGTRVTEQGNTELKKATTILGVDGLK
jgi:hypothetical protein